MSFKPQYSYNPHAFLLRQSAEETQKANADAINNAKTRVPKEVIQNPAQELKDLARIVARAFLSEVAFHVVDVLVEKIFTTADDISQQLQIPVKSVQQALNELKLHRITQEERYEIKGLTNSQSYHQFWFVHYLPMIDSVSFRCYVLLEKIPLPSSADPAISAAYKCTAPQCKMLYNDLDACTLMDPATRQFKCRVCGSLVEDLHQGKKHMSGPAKKKWVSQLLEPVVAHLERAQEVIADFDVKTDHRGFTYIVQPGYEQTIPVVPLLSKKGSKGQKEVQAQNTKSAQSTQAPKPDEKTEKSSKHQPNWFNLAKDGDQTSNTNNANGNENNNDNNDNSNSKPSKKHKSGKRAHHEEEERLNEDEFNKIFEKVQNSSQEHLDVDKASHQAVQQTKEDDTILTVAGVGKPYSQLTDEDLELMTDDEYQAWYTLTLQLYPTLLS